MKFIENTKGEDKTSPIIIKQTKLLHVIVFVFGIFGIVLAKGFWSTLFALFCPPWAWYLAAEYFITVINRL